MSKSKYEFYKEASLSQKLADKIPIYQQLAGSDPKVSEAIGILHILIEKGILDGEQPMIDLVLAILNVRRQALFATSERTNEITKMGLQMPKKESVITEF